MENEESMNKSSNDFWIDFIEQNRSEPSLWKIKSKEYLNRDTKREAYTRLLAKYKEAFPESTLQQLKKKINNMRSSFRRELKKINANQRSGASADDVYKPTLWYYKQSSFLMDQEIPSPSVTNITDSDDEDTEASAANTSIVNISNVWLLPEEGFPVFYRYFRDRITWFEADAVCQFHHAQLVTVDSSEQYDATRAYLKELDVVSHVWVGLKRSGSEGEFTWTDYKPLENGGYWQEQIPMTDNPVCAALDPAADFRWHPLNCGGPEVASFICQLEVPAWARKDDGCMLTSLPSLTVTYLPEQGAVELISDCGLEGTRRIACKGQANRDEMMKQLSCETSTESQTEAASSGAWDNELPTRHRRDTDVTLDMASVQHIVPTTEGLTEVDVVEVTNNPQSAEIKEIVPLTTGNPETSSPQIMPQEMSVAEEPIKTANGILPDEYQVQNLQEDVLNSSKSANRKINDHVYQGGRVLIPIDGEYAGLTSDESTGSSGGGRRLVLLGSNKPKPIPPSLKGNSPFIDPNINNNNNNNNNNNINNKSDNSNENSDGTTAKPVEKESHEVFRESTSDNLQHQEKPESKAIKFPPLSVYTINKDHDQDESSVRGSTQSPASSTESSEVTTKLFDENDSNSNDDSKFFTRVVAEELKIVGSTLNPNAEKSSKKNSKLNTDSDFLFIVTENPIKSSSSTEAPSIDNQTTLPPAGTSRSKQVSSDSTGEPDDSLTGIEIDDKPVAYAAQDREVTDDIEPEAPERPNRGRLLIRPQHHSFYPYFLNRVLG